jgi:hypothetical protein
MEPSRPARFIKSPSFNHHNPGPPSPDTLRMPPDILPSLQSLLTPSYFSVSILRSETTEPRPLNEVSIGAEEIADHRILGVLSTAPLKKIHFGRSTPEDLRLLASYVPNLTELSTFPWMAHRTEQSMIVCHRSGYFIVLAVFLTLFLAMARRPRLLHLPPTPAQFPASTRVRPAQRYGEDITFCCDQMP